MSKIALVTGANRGLGRNTALAIAKSGGDVIVTYRSNAQQAEEVVTLIREMGRQAVALPLDVADTASFPAFVVSLRAELRNIWGRDSFDHQDDRFGGSSRICQPALAQPGRRHCNTDEHQQATQDQQAQRH